MESNLTHLDESGQVKMVDVTEKAVTHREAVAKARVRMKPETVGLIKRNEVAKGSVLEVAKVAAILAAKKTPELIPLCHPLPLTHIHVEFALDEVEGIVAIESTVRTTYKTGVEVEALTAVTVAALTVFDMCKGVDKTIVIEQAYVAVKTGGKSGEVRFEPS
jgi:cyclic pyranopterin phosphate synthase